MTQHTRSQLPMEVIGKRIQSEDCWGTEEPLYTVMDQFRAPSGTTGETGEQAWFDEEGGEADEATAAILERYKRRFDQEPQGWSFRDVLLQEEFVTACFSETAATGYVDENRHNLRDPYIRVVSLSRNPEMRSVRNFLRSLATR